MIIRPMTIQDVSKLRLEEEWMYERFRNYFLAGIGPAFIVESEGHSICAFGALFEWGYSGACEVWFNLIERVHTAAAVKIIRRYLSIMAGSFQIKRMQAIVACEQEKNAKFLQFFGFHNETPGGMRHKMYNGGDAYLYARYF